MSAPPTPEQVLHDLVRRNAMVWLETQASILGRHRNLITNPELVANWIQRREHEVLEWMERHGMPGRVIKLKGRRQGSSTGTLAQMAHRVRARPTSAIIVGLDYAKNVRAMEETFWRFVETDRFDWGVGYKRRIGDGGDFTNDSKLTLQSANTPNAGRGDGAQFALFTEAAYYPDTEQRSQAQLFKSLFQLIPREPGTVIVIESTPAGEGGKFHETWLGAITFEELQAGKIPPAWNGFVKIFQAWHEFDDYTQAVTPEQEREIMASLSDRETELVELYGLDAGRLAWRRMVIAGPDFEGDEEEFESEYPSDDVRCFAASGRKYFNWIKLQEMRRSVSGKTQQTGYVELGPGGVASFVPSSERESGTWLRVWELPRHGMRYSVILDPMTGEQASGKEPDNHAIGVIRDGYFDSGIWFPPALVARACDCYGEVRSRRRGVPVCRWDVDVVEERIARLSMLYGKAVIVVEMNKDLGVVELLKRRGNMNLYRREEFNRAIQETKKVYGWMTNTQNRRAILEGLKIAVRTYRKPFERDADAGGIDIWDERVIGELERLVEKENGRIEAAAGSHDDTVLMLAIGLATKGKATMFTNRRELWDDDDDDRRRRRHQDNTWAD